MLSYMELPITSGEHQLFSMHCLYFDVGNYGTGKLMDGRKGLELAPLISFISICGCQVLKNVELCS